MSRLEKRFNLLRQMNQAGLIGFITAGDPSHLDTLPIADALIRGGVDILELGVPFSDPIADGPTIQASAHRALKARITPPKVFNIVAKIRERHDIPICLLTYYNLVCQMGHEAFLEECKTRGVDGVVIPDLPFDDAGEYRRIAHRCKVDTIFFATPTTPNDRLKKIIQSTSGFLYLVSLLGVTGARETVQQRTLRLVKRVHRLTSGVKPLAVGFGISKPEHVRSIVRTGAEGAIVGSAFINIIATYRNRTRKILQELEEYAMTLKEATKYPLHDKWTRYEGLTF